jgi:hypothetical protein
MSRILVRGQYNSEGAYELRYAEGSDAGEVHLIVSPSSIFQVGNSPIGRGQFFAKPINWAGHQRIAIVRLNGEEARLSPDELVHRFHNSHGFLLQTGALVLWAINYGSAEHQLFYSCQNVVDPIINALRAVRSPQAKVQMVSTFDHFEVEGTSWRSVDHNPGKWWTDFVTDGEVRFVRAGNKASSWIFEILGDSFCIRIKRQFQGGDTTQITIIRVIVTPTTEREVVANKIRQVMM